MALRDGITPSGAISFIQSGFLDKLEVGGAIHMADKGINIANIYIVTGLHPPNTTIIWY